VIVLDAGVLIAHLDERDAHHERASHLLAETRAEPLGASTITLAETLVAPARAGRLRDATRALTRLGVHEVKLGEEASTHLAQLRTDTGHKLPGCCVLLAAKETGAAIATFDSDLMDSARGLGLSTLP
jgi:predicted nucleic acid-binding protein